MSDLTTAELVERVREALSGPLIARKPALTALSELEERLEAAERLVGRTQLKREAAEREVERLRGALRRVKEKAESWHGPVTDDNRPANAIVVIAEWCADALATASGKRAGWFTAASTEIRGESTASGKESVIERKAREQRESPRGAPPSVLPDPASGKEEG